MNQQEYEAHVRNLHHKQRTDMENLDWAPTVKLVREKLDKEQGKRWYVWLMYYVLTNEGHSISKTAVRNSLEHICQFRGYGRLERILSRTNGVKRVEYFAEPIDDMYIIDRTN